jgi:hypothetical protein
MRYCNAGHELVLASGDEQQKLLARHNKLLSRIPAVCLYGQPASAVIQFGPVSLFHLALPNTVTTNENGTPHFKYKSKK